MKMQTVDIRTAGDEPVRVDAVQVRSDLDDEQLEEIAQWCDGWAGNNCIFLPLVSGQRRRAKAPLGKSWIAKMGDTFISVSNEQVERNLQA